MPGVDCTATRSRSVASFSLTILADESASARSSRSRRSEVWLSMPWPIWPGCPPCSVPVFSAWRSESIRATDASSVVWSDVVIAASAGNCENSVVAKTPPTAPAAAAIAATAASDEMRRFSGDTDPVSARTFALAAAFGLAAFGLAAFRLALLGRHAISERILGNAISINCPTMRDTLALERPAILDTPGLDGSVFETSCFNCCAALPASVAALPASAAALALALLLSQERSADEAVEILPTRGISTLDKSTLDVSPLTGSIFGLAALFSLTRLVVDATKILPAVRGGSTLKASATPPSSLTGSTLLASALAVSGTSLGDSILSVELPAAAPARASRLGLVCSAICSLTHTQTLK